MNLRLFWDYSEVKDHNCTYWGLGEINHHGVHGVNNFFRSLNIREPSKNGKWRDRGGGSRGRITRTSTVWIPGVTAVIYIFNRKVCDKGETCIFIWLVYSLLPVHFFLGKRTERLTLENIVCINLEQERVRAFFAFVGKKLFFLSVGG